MEVDQEVEPVTSKKKVDKTDSPVENSPSKSENKKTELKSDGEDPKPRIVLTFRSEKSGARSSAMKIVSTEEKQEEVSLRRSSRTVKNWTRKWDSDDDNETLVSPKKDKLDEEVSDSSQTPAKRSTSRRTKECENVVANAIARKEKSYNETPAPSRPSRRIKPTAKVLESQELHSHNEKSPEEGVRTRRSVRSSRQEEKPVKKCSKLKEAEDVEEESENKVMKLKHLCELGLKAINPNSEDSKDGDTEDQEAIEIDDEEGEDEEIDDDTEVISKLLEADAESGASSGEYDTEFLPRRSTRLHSSYNDSDGSSLATDDNAPLRRSKRKRPVSKTWRDEEAASAEEGSEAARPPEDSTVIGTCSCETPSNIYADPSELTEPVFCQAIEAVDGVRVGCSHSAARAEPLLRAGPRAPYFLACTLHAHQLRKHMCCPTCGLFCTQGIFYQCSLGHLFHLECGLPYNETKPKPGCPHCGVHPYGWQPANRECGRVRVRLHTSNKRILLPEQREQCTPAYLGFSTLDPEKLDQEPLIPEDLLPLPSVDLKHLSEKPGIDEDPTETAEALCEAILAGESIDQIIPKIVSRASINTPLPCLQGGTCVHAAARKGHVAALHVLHTAGADIDAVAAGKTPLMVAILELLDNPENKSPKKTKSGIDKDTEDMEVDDEVKEVKENKDDDKEEAKRASETERASDEDLMKVIRYLVAVGCDVNLPGPDGMTALHMAAQHGGAAVAAALLARPDACAEPRDQGGWSPLVWAAENGHHHTVKLLLNAGADATAVDAEGNGVVHWCALAGAARALALLLLAAPRAAHAHNAHRDTPLHVAARQGHFACVIILLARGARTDVENSAGELPIDVCSGKCAAAISLNMQMTAALDKPTPKRLLSSDISRGREAIPIPCINEVDDTPLPADFTYVTSHVMPTHICIDNTIENSQGCACVDGDCSSGGCACAVLSVRGWWARGRLARAFPYHDPPMLFECNATCSCHARKCTNSVVSRLLRTGSVWVPAAVFRAGGARGWGLRARAGVCRGAPVAAYVGELLALPAADARPADHYMFALDVKPDLLEQCSEKTQLCVDAAVYGGAARFINHSCRPNLAPVRVFTSARDLRLPAVALFAAQDIAAGDELTFDYGDKFWSVKSKWMQCECGTPECRYLNNSEESES